MESNEPSDLSSLEPAQPSETTQPAETAQPVGETAPVSISAPITALPAYPPAADPPAGEAPTHERPADRPPPREDGPPREERPPREDRPPRDGRPPRDQRRGPQGQGHGQQGRPGGRDRPDQRAGGQPQSHQSQGRQSQSQQPQPRQPWSKPDFLARAVKDGIDKEFIDGAAEFARSVGSGISPIHLRGIFGELARQEVSGPDPTRLLLIRPRLAYLTARAGRGEMKDLRQVIERGLEPVCAEGISDEERAVRLDRLCRGVEAIFAYQRMHERKGGERS